MTSKIMAIQKCLNCGKILKPVKDPKTKKITGHIFKCKCLGRNKLIYKG